MAESGSIQSEIQSYSGIQFYIYFSPETELNKKILYNTVSRVIVIYLCNQSFNDIGLLLIDFSRIIHMRFLWILFTDIQARVLNIWT